MAFVTVAAIAGATGGLIKAIDGGIKARKAKQEAEKAQKELEKNKEMYKGLDTSNPYLNMENTMEDLTVDKQEAEFMKQQQMQQQANVMQQMRGAAGSSGIAALAQSIANQGALDAQKAAASIGKQEAANQAEERKEKSRLLGLEREGELISRQAEHGKVTSLMGMSADELANQRAAQTAAHQQMWSGVGDIAGSLMQARDIAAGAKKKTPVANGTPSIPNDPNQLIELDMHDDFEPTYTGGNNQPSLNINTSQSPWYKKKNKKKNK